jgi:hypothetical protein
MAELDHNVSTFGVTFIYGTIDHTLIVDEGVEVESALTDCILSTINGAYLENHGQIYGGGSGAAADLLGSAVVDNYGVIAGIGGTGTSPNGIFADGSSVTINNVNDLTEIYGYGDGIRFG